MHIETERKFLVKDSRYKAEAVRSMRICQGYIAHDKGNTVRVRIRDDRGILTIKGPSLSGMSRPEWEKEITQQEAEGLLQLCHGGRVEKIRHLVPSGTERFFEVDEFLGDNEGLVLAEIELGTEDEVFERPAWLGEEVTGDKHYYNAFLSKFPYKEW